MKRRVVLMGYGAVGVVIAALIYFGVMPVRGILNFLLLLPEGGVVILIILLFVSLLELFVVWFGLRQLAASAISFRVLGGLVILYVAFASVYAALLLLFVREVWGAQMLAALSGVRWLSLWWIQPKRA